MVPRTNLRIRCSASIEASWLDRKRGQLRVAVTLLDISRHGARIVSDLPIPVGTQVELAYPGGTLVGKAATCTSRKPLYSIGITFEPGSEWSPRLYRPKGAEGFS
jgi:hypothetical protein